MPIFVHVQRLKVHLEVGGGQKRAKLCPRSHWMSPYSSHEYNMNKDSTLF